MTSALPFPSEDAEGSEELEEDKADPVGWPFVARLLAAAALLTGLAHTRPEAVAGSVALVLLAVVYLVGGYVIGRNGARLPENARVVLPVADVAVVGAACWLLASPPWLAVACLAALPIVAAVSWTTERDLGVIVAVAVSVLAAVAGIAGPHHGDAGPVVAVAWALGAAGVWTAFFVGGSAAQLAADRARADEAEASFQKFRSTIVTTVSHELRTPLTVIQGLTSTLNARWDVLAEAARLDLVDAIALNVASLDASVLHFIDAGRIERGEVVMRQETVDVEKLVKGVLTKLGPVLAGHDVRTDVAARTAWADREALARMLELLLSNAARFAPLGSPVVVRSKAAGDDGSVELSVTDRGPGIPPQQLKQVFEPFWRADVSESGVSRGAGLGLAIVKGLATMHGGDASVTSVRGRGSTFRILLPGQPDPLASTPAPPPAKSRRR